MRDERRKEERSKQGQTNNKAKQHSTLKAVTFEKNELPRVHVVLDLQACTLAVALVPRPIYGRGKNALPLPKSGWE